MLGRATPSHFGRDDNKRVLSRFCEFILNLIDSDLIDWSEIPYIQTGYSYAGLGEATTVRKSLYYPVTSYNNQLIFAGEHTSADFYGFMEGALQSGCRAAMQIITQVNETHTINI